MIVLRNLTKVFHVNGNRTVVADNINMTFPTGRNVGLLGRNGAGKSTLLRMIAGTTMPTAGDVLSTGTISYLVGFAGSFHRDLTGAQNTRFVARVYGVDTDELVDFVQDFAELGPHFHMPFHTYSAGMRARLSFGVSMGIPFDTYLMDEVTSVGDGSFRRKSIEVFTERRRHASSILVSHSPPMIRSTCDSGAVLENGRLTYYEDLEEAIDRHEQNMKG